MDRTTRPDEGGFTLVELLVVMIVIGILAAVAIPAFLGNRARAHETSAKSDAKQIVQQISAMLVDGPASSITLGEVGRTWTLTSVVDGETATTQGELSPGNDSVLAWSALNPDVYCVTVSSGPTSFWSASSTGLFKGSSCV